MSQSTENEFANVLIIAEQLGYFKIVDTVFCKIHFYVILEHHQLEIID